MNKRYLRNSKRFNKYGDYRAGSIVRRSCSRIKTDDPAKEDRENREQVVDEIRKLIDSGTAIEDACSTLVKKYKDRFRYLPENRLDEIFADWYNGRMKGKNKAIEGRTW